MPNFADIGLRARALNQYGLPEIGYSVPLADVQLTPAGSQDGLPSSQSGRCAGSFFLLRTRRDGAIY